MAFAIRQQGEANSGSASVSFTFTSAQIAGNSNVIFIASDEVITGGTDLVVDNNASGNTYVRVATVNDATDNVFGGVWWCPKIKAAGANVNKVTFTFTGATTLADMWCVEASGGPFALDTVNGSGGNAVGGNSAAPSASYTTSALAFLLGYCFTNDSVNSGSQGAGWTQVAVSGIGSQLQDRTAATPGSFTAQCTTGGAAAWAQVIIALIQASAANAPLFGSD